MNPTAIFWPMIAHVALVFGIYLLLRHRRVAAYRAGNATPETFRLNRDEPAESVFVRNNLANQFELPVLFYAACLSLFVTGGVGAGPVVLAWVFALSRYAHTFVQVTTNRVRHRFQAFAVGFAALGLLWLWLAAHLLVQG